MTLSLFDGADAISLEQRLRDCFDAWIAHRAQSNSRDRTQRALSEESAIVYREMWHAFVAFCVDRRMDLKDLREGDIDNFLISRGTGDHPTRPRVATKGDELSPRYARRFLTLIDRLTRFQAEMQGLPVNMAAHDMLQRPEYRYANASHKDPLPDYLNAAQAKRLIAYVTQLRGTDPALGPVTWKDVRDRTAVATMLGAGLAPGDVRAAQLDGVIIEGGRKAGLPWKLALPGNGNSPARETPIAEWAGRQLAFWLQVRREQNMPGDYLFPSTSSGRAWSHTGCFEATREVLLQAGLGSDAGGLFKLRHTFALRQLSKGKSEADVARWLGLLDVNGMSRYRGIVMSQVEVV
ncbi:Site-specific recombinase XerD [Noviherbaspirillum humi]|uniref:Site-specific recombinase XerD n=1 Tax=Noviherbaspirillum humi TaxID=1688639 RepID=A0A239LKK1_9BURK|nr:tyrosine-type recombinase/integrase [Noviherbaspirillum humi]SNT30104.1 Site-specific recombinase XerD [Noviherbaspirillum humi]